MNYDYVDQNRAGDHICYYSDLRKMTAHYPGLETSPSPCDDDLPGDLTPLECRLAPLMKILITGICGFVGRTLAVRMRERSTGREGSCAGSTICRGPVRSKSGHVWQRRGVEFIHGDVRNRGVISRKSASDCLVDRRGSEPERAGGPRRQISPRLLFETQPRWDA